MKKILLSLTAALMAVAMQASTNVYADFQKVSGNSNVAWDASTNTLSVWGSSGNTYQMFSFEQGYLSKCEKIHITINDKDHTRVLFMNGNTTVYTWTFGSAGTKDLSLTTINNSFTAEQIATVTAIRIGGRNVSDYTEDSPCQLTIDPSDTYLVAPDEQTGDGETLYASFAKVSGNSNVSWDADNNILSVWGSSGNTYQMFAFDAGTLSKYEKIHFTINDKDHTRILFMAGNTTLYTWTFGSNGEKNINIAEINANFTAEQIATVTAIRIGGRNVSNYTAESPCQISIDPAGIYLKAAATPTGVVTVKAAANADSSVVYSLSGQRVSADYKGIVIKNGRKYIVK